MTSAGIIVADLVVRTRSIPDPVDRRRLEWIIDCIVVAVAAIIWTATLGGLALRHFNLQPFDWFWLFVAPMVLASEGRSVLRGPHLTSTRQ